MILKEKIFVVICFILLFFAYFIGGVLSETLRNFV